MNKRKSGKEDSFICKIQKEKFMKQRFALPISLLFILFLFSFSKAEACSCRSSNSPCAVYQSADTVFLATAEEIAQSENSFGRKIKLKTDEAFKGINSKEETVFSGGMCSFHFTAGKKYLVYAKRDKETNELRVHLCSRTTSLEYGARDLEFIRLMVAGKSVSSIYGKVEQRTGKENPRSLALQNIKLAVVTDSIKKENKYVPPKDKDKLREVLTDAGGNYRFDDLPVGKHRLKIFLPNDLTTWKDEFEFGSGDQSCAQYDFSVQVDGRINGKIVADNGEPLPRAYVQLSATNYNPYFYIPGAQTDIDGNYEIKGILPGKYKLSVSSNVPNSNYSFPFPRYYYPATFNESEAKILELGYAEKIQNINLKMLPVSFTKKIQIEVVWEDETPISPPNVHYKVFAGTAETSSNYVHSDKEGKPTLTIFSGFEYQIYAFGSLKDGRLYETDKIIVKAENTEDIIKLKARLRR